MKVWKRGKARMRPSPEFRWIPQGYYKNRPKLIGVWLDNGIGRVETVRFIEAVG